MCLCFFVKYYSFFLHMIFDIFFFFFNSYDLANLLVRARAWVLQLHLGARLAAGLLRERFLYIYIYIYMHVFIIIIVVLFLRLLCF